MCVCVCVCVCVGVGGCVCVCVCVWGWVCVGHPVNHSNELLTEFTHAGAGHKIDVRVCPLIYFF